MLGLMNPLSEYCISSDVDSSGSIYHPPHLKSIVADSCFIVLLLLQSRYPGRLSYPILLTGVKGNERENE